MFSILVSTSLALFGLLYLLRRQQESFCIRIEGIHLNVKRGRPPQALLSHCQQLMQDARTLKGTIRGVKKGSGITLSCSRSIPASYRQDIRLFWQKQPQPEPSVRT
ncbi:DUF3634 domain-containing protein [Zobellella endophytica]|uniref:DUF3634 domain-containing protein n=1 Tax=Zobellella endophytica TaxID=2116700 RepID=A0A2P7R2M3_9GAMM|nr:DUF3634 family protein [Zobellella endophytica]PSJ44463.1 DUF3634 domain-containing protein [Zobellella endophytica]